MSTQDRWGEDHERQDATDSDSSTSWIILAVVLLLLLLVAAGGFIFFRATSARQMAAMERDRAVMLEHQLQVARAATKTSLEQEASVVIESRLKEGEVAKARHFPNREEAIVAGNELLAFMRNQPDPKIVDAFVGREAVFFGIGTNPANELILAGSIRLVAKINPIIPQPVGLEVVVFGKILSINHEPKTITIEAQRENWILAGKP